MNRVMNTLRSSLVGGLLAAGALLISLSSVWAGDASSSGGSDNVSPYYGSFASEVPIAIPAYHGLEPSLKVTYGSSGGNALAGVGWSLSGFSYVERSSSGSGAPRFNSGDSFYLDGMELIESNLQGGTHCARIQNYTRIIRDAANDRWYVIGTGGNKATYESKLTTPQGTFRWLLTRMEDPRGNAVTYEYSSDGNDCYLSAVRYNGIVVTCYWEARPDPIVFGNGSALRRTSKRLKTVDVQVGGGRARAYSFAYQTSPATGRSLLINATQYGRDAILDGNGAVTAGSFLPPMRMGYQTDASATFGSRVLVDTGMDLSGYTRLIGDVTGDGRSDVVYATTTAFETFISLRDGSFAGPYHGGPGSVTAKGNPILSDVDGDGAADVIFLDGSVASVYFSNHAGKFENGASRAFGKTYTTDGGWVLTIGDGNADGEADIICIGDSAIEIWLSEGVTGWAAAPVATTGVGNFANYTHTMGDFNGDGKADVAYINDTGFSVLFGRTNATFEAAVSDTTDGVSFSGYDRLIGDANGDGRADIFYVNESGFSVFQGVGDGTFAPRVQGTSGGASFAGYERRIDDINSDGRSDIYYLGSDGCSTFLGLGDGTFGPRIADTSDGLSFSTNNFSRTLADFNGDGKNDVVYVGTNSFSFFRGAGSFPDLLNHLENGIGGTTDISYTPSTFWNNTFMPQGLLLHTVDALTTSDGRGNTNTVDYSYEGGLWSKDEKRFLGFRRVSAVIDAEGNYTETYYFQRVGSISKPEFTFFKDNQGRIYSYTAYKYTENAAPPYTSLLTERWDYEMNLTDRARRSLIQMAYDMYGNVIASYEYGDFDVQGDERTMIRGYYPNHTAYIIGYPAYENTYSGIGSAGQLMRRTLYLFDNNTTHEASPRLGNLTEIRKWLDTENGYVVQKKVYDAYGNVIREVDPCGYESVTEYDSVYHAFPVLQRNALGHELFTAWDTVLGLKTSVKDSNGAVTAYGHDAFGRRTAVTNPDDSVETYAYLDWGNPSLQRTRKTLPDGSADGLWAEMYQDGLGRICRTVKEGGFTNDKEFLGAAERVKRESLTYLAGESPRWISHSYDGAGRPRRAVNPDGTYSEVVYSMDEDAKPYQAVYDELGHEKVIWKDTQGNLLSVREGNRGERYQTSYQYDIIGNLLRVTDALGRSSSFIYDSLGRKVAGQDMDMGRWTYQYDPYGKLLSQTDAKGQTVRFEYDALGRVLTKNRPDGPPARWFYDESGYGSSIGRLTRVVHAAGEERHVWDLLGQEVSTVRGVGSRKAAFHREFDSVGRLSTLTYPGGERVVYNYDSCGRLQSVPGYVDSMTWNSGGQLLEMRYANGTASTYSYDANRLWLSTANVSGPTGLLYNATYVYDDAARVAAVGSTTDAKANLSYTYDDLDRLLVVDGAQDQRFTYDSTGSMTYNSKVGRYTFEDASHAHAVTMAGGEQIVYDDNGNRVSDGKQTYEWDSENRLRSVTRGGKVTSYAYDSDGNRVRRSTGNDKTLYFGALYEEHGGHGSCYVYAGPILVCKRDGAAKMWYHADHLGSIRLTSDGNGHEVNRYTYSSFGSVIEESGSADNDRAFTGHTRDRAVDLTYMVARYNVAETGCFISPDSIVPDPANPQALNRYAYVYNNPISNVDPTGHAPVAVALISACLTTAATTSTIITAVAWIGAGLSIAGYLTKDPIMSSVGAVMLGFAGGFVNPVGGLTAIQGGILGGTVAAATSPISPLDPGVKQTVGWAYTAIGVIDSIMSAQSDAGATSGTQKSQTTTSNGSTGKTWVGYGADQSATLKQNNPALYTRYTSSQGVTFVDNPSWADFRSAVTSGKYSEVYLHTHGSPSGLLFSDGYRSLNVLKPAASSITTKTLGISSCYPQVQSAAWSSVGASGVKYMDLSVVGHFPNPQLSDRAAGIQKVQSEVFKNNP